MVVSFFCYRYRNIINSEQATTVGQLTNRMEGYTI